MTRNGLFAGALGLAGLLIGAGLAMKPVQAQNGASFKIYVINVNKVLKDYKVYQSKMESFRASLEEKNQRLKSTEEMVRAKMVDLRNLKNPADREGLEREINDLRFELERSRRKFQAEMIQAEADIVASCYADMTELLTTYCEEKKCYLVLRLHNETDKKDVPQAVLENVARNVVYSHKYLDLTQVITDGLNARS